MTVRTKATANPCFFLSVVFIAAFSSSAAQADVIVLGATDAGFVTEVGGSAKGDGTLVAAATFNYSVGQEEHYVDGSLGVPPATTPLAFMDRNNYFLFDLSLITEPIIGATLMLPAGMLESVDPTETFHLVAPVDPGAAIGDAEALLIGNGVGFTEFDEPTDPLVSVAAALYGNIETGAGDILGTSVISSADDFSTLSIALDPLGIGYLNAFLGGPVILGGNVSTITPGPTTEQPFGFTGPVFPTLTVVTIPEPGSLLLVAMVVPVLIARRRRRRCKMHYVAAIVEM